MSFSLSICEVLLGIIKTYTTDTRYYTQNYVIVLGKWFINLKKNNKEKIWFSYYIAHVKNKVRILKESFTVTNNVNVFKQRYGILYVYCLFWFYVAFNTVQVISRRVV